MQGFNSFLFPPFPREILQTEPDGAQILRNADGMLVREKPGVQCIASEIGTSLTDRQAWEELFLPRLQDSADRLDQAVLDRMIAENDSDLPRGLLCGSFYGNIRNMLGVQELAYLAVDDEDLYREIIDTVGTLVIKTVRRVLETGVRADYAHIWEDICFRNGPLVNPSVFRELVGPHYKALTKLLSQYGIDIVQVDCDGWIDALVPIWVENGVNTMFPIEVGVWGGCIDKWRSQYGRQVRGLGGMNKLVFAQDKAAVDRELERLRPLVDLGGYLPCPDHMIPPDSDFRLVAYYCEQFHKIFG